MCLPGYYGNPGDGFCKVTHTDCRLFSEQKTTKEEHYAHRRRIKTEEKAKVMAVACKVGQN